MKSLYSASVALVFTFFIATSAHAGIINVTWTGASTIGASPHTIPIGAPFYSDGFLGASGGTYSFDRPGVSERGFLEARIDGVWTELATTAIQGSGSVALPTAFTANPFPVGLVDGVRLVRNSIAGSNLQHTESNCDFFDGCWRNMTDVSFSFNEVPAPTPEPSSFGLLLLSLLVGVGFVRKRV